MKMILSFLLLTLPLYQAFDMYMPTPPAIPSFDYTGFSNDPIPSYYPIEYPKPSDYPTETYFPSDPKPSDYPIETYFPSDPKPSDYPTETYFPSDPKPSDYPTETYFPSDPKPSDYPIEYPTVPKQSIYPIPSNPKASIYPIPSIPKPSIYPVPTRNNLRATQSPSLPFTMPESLGDLNTLFTTMTGTMGSLDNQKDILKQMEDTMREQMEQLKNTIKENIKHVDLKELKDALGNMDNLPGEIKNIMKDMRDTIKDIIKDVAKESIRNTKEEIKSMIDTMHRDGEKNISDFEHYITNVYDTFGELRDVTTNITTSLLDMKDTLRMIGTLAITEDEAHVFENKNENFTLHATYVEGRKKRVFASDDTHIAIPILPFENQTLSVISWTQNPYSELSSKPLFSKVISIMLSDYSSGNETRVFGLDAVINITLPISNLDIHQNIPVCMYWNDADLAWKYDGCAIQNITSTSVICGCSHLTDFSVGVQESESSSNSIFSKISKSTYIGIGVGGACLLIGIVAFVVVRKLLRKKETKKVAVVDVSTSNPVTLPQETNPIHKISSVSYV